MNEISGQARRDIEQALAVGRKLEAIRLCRQATGLGLKEAKDAIEALQADGGRPESRDEVWAGARELRSLGAEGRARVRSLLQRGQKIEAIKQYRADTGVGLKEAKEAVDAMELSEAGEPVRTDTMSRAGGSKRFWLFVVSLVVLAWLLLGRG